MRSWEWGGVRSWGVGGEKLGVRGEKLGLGGGGWGCLGAGNASLIMSLSLRSPAVHQMLLKLLLNAGLISRVNASLTFTIRTRVDVSFTVAEPRVNSAREKSTLVAPSWLTGVLIGWGDGSQTGKGA